MPARPRDAELIGTAHDSAASAIGQSGAEIHACRAARNRAGGKPAAARGTGQARPVLATLSCAARRVAAPTAVRGIGHEVHARAVAERISGETSALPRAAILVVCAPGRAAAAARGIVGEIEAATAVARRTRRCFDRRFRGRIGRRLGDRRVARTAVARRQQVEHAVVAAPRQCSDEDEPECDAHEAHRSRRRRLHTPANAIMAGRARNASAAPLPGRSRLAVASPSFNVPTFTSSMSEFIMQSPSTPP
jgi:hypothetical protein